jgi:hypothetical protein
VRWWIASDPRDALETGTITVGHFDPRCWDRLNRLYFRFPTLNENLDDRIDDLVVLFEPSLIAADEPGYYFRNGHTLEDSGKDFISFFNPLNEALLHRLRTRPMLQREKADLAPVF